MIFKIKTVIDKARNETTTFDKLIKVLDYIPGFVKGLTIGLLRAMDYFGWLPCWLKKLSPFHGSLFITSMASLGLPPIYHHIYNFGTTSVFIAIGKNREVAKKKNGEIAPANEEKQQ